MNEEARPTVGYLPCSEEQAREIFEALRQAELAKIDRTVWPLVESAHVDAMPDGGKEDDA